MGTNDNNRRRPGNRMKGAGRRTYPDAAGPRVGRIASNVPRARQVTADGESDAVEREVYRGNQASLNSTLHRGSAYRAPSGPRSIEREGDLPDDEHILAGRNPIREALRAGRPVEKLLVAAGELSGAAQEIIRMARDAGAVVQQVDRSRLDQI